MQIAINKAATAPAADERTAKPARQHQLQRRQQLHHRLVSLVAETIFGTSKTSLQPRTPRTAKTGLRRSKSVTDSLKLSPSVD